MNLKENTCKLVKLKRKLRNVIFEMLLVKMLSVHKKLSMIYILRESESKSRKVNLIYFRLFSQSILNSINDFF